MNTNLHLAENGSGLLLLPPLKPGGPSLVLEAEDLPHFVARADWAPVTALPATMTKTLHEWLQRWRLSALRVQKNFERRQEEIVVDLLFSNGLRAAFADPPAAITAQIAQFDVVFTSQGVEHATVRRTGERLGALSIAIGLPDADRARSRFSGFPNPQLLSVEVADAWEEKWGTRPRPSQVANVGGGTW